MKRQYKISPDAMKQIETIASEMPLIYEADEKGNAIYQNVVKRLVWEEMTDDQKKQFDFKKPDDVPVYKRMSHGRKVVDFKRPATITFTQKVPLQMNHLVNLIQAYKSGAEQGVIDYVEAINDIVVEGKRKQVEAANKVIEDAAKNNPAKNEETKILKLNPDENV